MKRLALVVLCAGSAVALTGCDLFDPKVDSPFSGKPVNEAGLAREIRGPTRRHAAIHLEPIQVEREKHPLDDLAGAERHQAGPGLRHLRRGGLDAVDRSELADGDHHELLS